MAVSRTVLAVGQCYLQPDDLAGMPGRYVTIVRLDRDRHGFPLVTFRFPNGREVDAYAAQVEAALAAGHLIPVEDEPLALAA